MYETLTGHHVSRDARTLRFDLTNTTSLLVYYFWLGRFEDCRNHHVMVLSTPTFYLLSQKGDRLPIQCGPHP